ncbi:MAG: prolipoprotein diacylglyceryl transferase [Bacillota bacterium]|nr:prolipoprotein diacylglyceryl transferase [Bacillota bacterium]
MLDSHIKIEGFMPYIFGIPSYGLFVFLGIAAGILYYLIDARKRNVKNEGAVLIVASALIFGAVGSKIPLLLEYRNLAALISGKSIVGGLIGGAAGVIIVKKAFGIKLKLGNIIAPAIALGMSIGRLGCFFNGCCYGVASSWGVDFGDGLLRLPTQLFESAFHFTAFLILHNLKGKVLIKGILFKYYILAYFIFRFITEFIRENQTVWGGMSIYQIICALGIVYVSFIIWKENKVWASSQKSVDI